MRKRPNNGVGKPPTATRKGVVAGTSIERSNAVVRLLRLPASLARKAYNNKGFVRTVINLSTAQTEAERQNALNEVERWHREKFHRPEYDERLSKARGLAQALLAVPWVRDQLESTPHLGLLSRPKSVLYPYVHRRIDYVAEIVSLADEFRLMNRGVGLNSPATISTQFEAKEITALEMIQVWAILQSASHLFGTFATERALLFALRDNDGAGEEFKAAIADELRPEVEGEFARANMYSFVRALMAWRVTRHLDGDLQRSVLGCVKAYISHSRVARHKEIFRRLRQVAYLRMQRKAGIDSGVNTPPDVENELKQLISGDDVLFQPFERVRTPYVDLLRSIDNYQYRTFFTSDESSLIALRHLRDFRGWWRSRRQLGQPIPELIDSLFSRPPDWVDRPHEALNLVGRVELVVNGDEWYEEVRAWYADGKPWAAANTNFYLSHMPGTNIGTLLLYGGAVREPVVVHHVVRQLERHGRIIAGLHGKSEVPSFWRTVAIYLKSLLKMRLVETRALRLDPIDAHAGRVGYVVLSDQRVTAAAHLQDLIGVIKNKDRIVELEAIKSYLSSLPERPGTLWAVFVAQLRCFHTDGHEDGDLDGVIAEVSPSGTRWHLLEVKSGTGSPTKQTKKTARWFGVSDGDTSRRKFQGSHLGIVLVEEEEGSERG